MRAFDRFEAACERMVEGSIGKLFRHAVQPAEIGRKLEKTMGANPVISVESKIVPNDYAVTLNPADFEPLAGFAIPLCRQFEAWLGETANNRGWTTIDRVRVRIDPDAAVRRREVRVVSAISSVPAAPPGTSSTPLGANPRVSGNSGAQGLRLRVLSGAQRGQEVLVLPPAATVGRAAGNDIVLHADDISRRHARIEIGRGGARVVDLGSTNGTTVNGCAVASARFGPGDALAFGSVAVEVLSVPADRSGR